MTSYWNRQRGLADRTHRKPDRGEPGDAPRFALLVRPTAAAAILPRRFDGLPLAEIDPGSARERSGVEKRWSDYAAFGKTSHDLRRPSRTAALTSATR